ncbi:MAG: uroporphyrinogen decarboxylase [Zetaproteobacteria bacterium]|nr:uroporphyrinogen decarboxylase [Zetaproteobacteria bacterium]
MKVRQPVVQVLQGDHPDRHPIWFLRQAGRYLPEYQNVRKDVSFVELCQSPQLAAEVTLQPLRRFDLDAAIIFSDILIPALHLGQNLRFDKGHGPLLTPPVRSLTDVQRLKGSVAMLEAQYVGEAIALVRCKLDPSQVLFGFAGAPVTVASYMIEGGGSKHYVELNRSIASPQGFFQPLIEKLTEATIAYLKMQREAGADALVLFDTWAGQLSCESYREYALPSLEKIFAWARSENVPLVYYPGQGWQHMSTVLQGGPAGIALDWRFDWQQLAQLTQGAPHLAVQGNLNPMVLASRDKAFVVEQVQKVCTEASRAGFASRHIFNVGHGLTPYTYVEAVQWAIEAVRNWKS